MNIRPLSKREKSILYIILVLFFASFVFNFVIGPTVVKLDQINQSIEKKSFLLRRYSRLVDKGEDIHSLYEQCRESLRGGSNAEEALAGLFKNIESSAKMFNMNIKSIKPQPVEKKKKYREASLEVKLDGSFRSVFQFIEHMETSSGFVKVTAIQLFPQPGTPSLLQARITFSQLVF